MNFIKIALAAGALASVSSLAFAQGGGATAGVNFDSLYQAQSYADGGVSYARADKRNHARAVRNTASQQRQTTGNGYTTGAGVGSPD